ncbi:uncharacterized protein LOC101852500 [Aplysia californica]|uniref:Uncharacterized protein LOC101852500 n=1 Tax=Aplysia californica TaxID=6500 RepID=A0ABM1A7V3_APLCA|nr:uncharacterized protein LOC101852500 [Aplysia californica]
MEFVACLAEVSFLLVLVSQSAFSEGSPQRHVSLRTNLIKRMDGIQSQLADVTSNLMDLDSDLEKALYECLDIRSDLCEAIKIEAGLKDMGSLGPYWMAGKRSRDPQVNKYAGLLQELRRKRAVLKRLMKVFHGADNVLRSERKRSCTLNLGFHCQTEEISNFADMYDFLSSPLSPGKKRSVRAVA